jgi:hypothetical protein
LQGIQENFLPAKTAHPAVEIKRNKNNMPVMERRAAHRNGRKRRRALEK